MTRTEGRLGRNRFVGGVSLGPGPELEYNNGTDSSPHRGSRDGWRAVVPGGGGGGWTGGGTLAIGGDTAASGGD